MEQSQAPTGTENSDVAKADPAVQQGPIPKYKCHKEVHALQIDTIELNGNGALLTFTAGYAARQVGLRVAQAPGLGRGGYLVIYADGYQSFSPQKQFEEGYERINGQ